jgi:hypothetical protein
MTSQKKMYEIKLVSIICPGISGRRAFLPYLAISCQIAKFSCFHFFRWILPFSITENYFKFELNDSNSGS